MKNKKAFTLIELLVVIAIIGIIATLAVVALQQARQNARDAKRVADVKQMSTALEMYFNEHQSYPASLEDLKVSGYMQIIPEAPSVADGECTPEQNEYTYGVDGQGAVYQIEFCVGKQVSDLGPGSLCMTPGGLTVDCLEIDLAPDPNPFCDPNEPVVFVDENNNGYLDIHTCCELSAIRNNPSANYELVNNIDCSNAENWVYDITYKDEGYDPDYMTSNDYVVNGFPVIADFAGNLNGNNYAISGFYPAPASGSPLYNVAGLVSVSAGHSASISNLKIRNSKMYSGNTNAYAFLSPVVRGDLSINNVSLVDSSIQVNGGVAGGFVGTVEAGGSLSISNSSVNNLDANQGGSMFGGLVGLIYEGAVLLIDNSHVSNSIFSSGGSGLGGLIVYIYGSYNNTFSKVISNSSVTNLEMNCLSCGGMGGIASGVNNLKLENSYVSGVDLINSGSSGVGGMFSYANDVDIDNSYVKNIKLLIPDEYNGGGNGYAGFFQSGNRVNISNSHADNVFIRPKSSGCGAGIACSLQDNSSITNSYVSNLDIFSEEYNGGLAGLVNILSGSNIVNTHVRNSIISNAAYGTSGFIGSMQGGRIDNSHVVNTDVISLGGITSGLARSLNGVSVSNSSFRGGSVSASLATYGNVSGFVSNMSNSNVSNSFVEGNISASYSSSNGKWLSGFFGDHVGSGNTITNSYFSGELIGEAEYKSCFSFLAASISQSYYNSDKCDTVNYSSAIGLSDAQMKDPSSYSGWNINTPSCSGADDNNPWRWTSGNYPCLYSDLTCSCS